MLSWAQLERWVERNDPPTLFTGRQHHEGCQVIELSVTGWISHRTNIDRSLLYGYRARGAVSPAVADRIAIRLGVHPVFIWPEFHEVAC
jgi:lambda repressor-like predicted transcriptional regulator